jgi:signal transduction histidine kinase
MARRSASILIGLAAAIVVTLLLASDLPAALELPARDLVLRLLPRRPANATVIVAIDERSVRSVGPWPWPRATLARLVDRAADARARGAIVDILLTEARPGDALLANAMRRLPSIAVCVLADRGQWLVPAPAFDGAAIVGHGNFELDRDGILRRFASTKQDRRRAYTAVSFEAASLMRATPVPVGRSVAPMFRTAPRDVPVVSAVDLLRDPSASRVLRGMLVFIGPTALGLGDRVLTPVSTRLAPDTGVSVHAAATESILRGEEVRALPPLLGGAFAGVIVGSVVAARRRARNVRIAIATAFLFAIVAGGYALLATTGIAVPWITLMLALLLAAGGAEATRMASRLRQSRDAAARLETNLGLSPAAPQDEVGIRLEEIATRLAERRAQELESQRVLAHELRTPLASMRNLTQLLGGFELSEGERRRVTALLEAEAGKLQLMVTELLDLERLALRNFDSASNVTDLGMLAAARVELLRAGSDRPLVVDAPAGIRIRGDAILLERIIDNLVSNAMKYTPPQTPVHVAVARNDGAALLVVEDRGLGIPASERTRVFQRFARGSTAAGTEGLGLGLALVAEVARWHRGDVAVEDAEGGGARFIVTLPVAEDQR